MADKATRAASFKYGDYRILINKQQWGRVDEAVYDFKIVHPFTSMVEAPKVVFESDDRWTTMNECTRRAKNWIDGQYNEHSADLAVLTAHLATIGSWETPKTVLDLREYLDSRRHDLAELEQHHKNYETYNALIVAYMALNNGVLQINNIGVTSKMQNIYQGAYMVAVKALKKDIEICEEFFLRKGLSSTL